MAQETLDKKEQKNPDLFDNCCSTCKDLMQENLQNCGLTEPLRRVLLIGRLKYVKRSEIKHEHHKMIKNIQKNIAESSSKLSGLMIIDKCFFYHAVEGSDDALNEVINRTAEFVSKELMYNAKIIRGASIAFRYFAKWHCCIIMTPEYVSTNFEEPHITGESSIPQLAYQIEKFEDNIFVLASYVRYLKTDDPEEDINDLVPTSVLPSETELEELYKEPFFIPVQTYVKRYLTQLDYISYIEEEWPPTGPLHDAKTYFEELDAYEKHVEESLEAEELEKKKSARYGSWWWSQ